MQENLAQADGRQAGGRRARFQGPPQKKTASPKDCLSKARRSLFVAFWVRPSTSQGEPGPPDRLFRGTIPGGGPARKGPPPLAFRQGIYEKNSRGSWGRRPWGQGTALKRPDGIKVRSRTLGPSAATSLRAPNLLGACLAGRRADQARPNLPPRPARPKSRGACFGAICLKKTAGLIQRLFTKHCGSKPI